MDELLTHRYSRSSHNIEAINRYPSAIIGVGAIGSQVAEQLAKMGVTDITLIDPDVVAAHNLVNQGFYEQDVGKPKVSAVAEKLKLINSEIEVTQHFAAWDIQEHKNLLPNEYYLFSLPDCIAVRAKVFKIAKRCPAIFDARMSSQVCEAFTMSRMHSDTITKYANSLFPKSEALRESCTQQSTIYCASFAASCLCSMFSQYANFINVGMFMTHWAFNLPTLSTVAADRTFI